MINSFINYLPRSLQPDARSLLSPPVTRRRRSDKNEALAALKNGERPIPPVQYTPEVGGPAPELPEPMRAAVTFPCEWEPRVLSCPLARADVSILMTPTLQTSSCSSAIPAVHVSALAICLATHRTHPLSPSPSHPPSLSHFVLACIFLQSPPKPCCTSFHSPNPIRISTLPSSRTPTNMRRKLGFGL